MLKRSEDGERVEDLATVYRVKFSNINIMTVIETLTVSPLASLILGRYVNAS